jgi:hypothetical protein
MSYIPVAFSLMASFMSSITLLGVSSENYSYGTQFLVINFAYIVGTPIAAYFYLPVFYNLQNSSAYQVISQFIFLLLLLTRFYFSVFGTTFWEGNETLCQFGLHYSDGSVYGYCCVCTCISASSCNRIESGCLYCGCWFSLHLLLNSRRHESSPHY